MKFWFRATFASATTVLLLAGCSLIPFPFSRAPVNDSRPDPTEENVAEELRTYYNQELRWEDCGKDTDCTDVRVPLDWAAPEGETISIALARHRGQHHIGSLLINPGGPGGSGVDFVLHSVDYIVTPEVLRNYDIIGFDPRGVGRSTPVICYTDPEEQDRHLYGTYTDPYGSEGWLTELQERSKSWADTCYQNSGELLGHLDAASVARDMDVIRALLGDPALNYLGYSYGTYLGTVYAELFPDKVGRLVLDGAVDPSVGDLEALTIQMAGFDSALRAYMQWCLDGQECPVRRDSVDEALTLVRGILDTVDEQGLVSSDGRKLDSATVATGIIYPLYSESAWWILSEAFAALRKGDPDPFFASADGYNGRESDGSYADNSLDIYTAVTCTEGDLAHNGVSTLDGLARIDEAAPILGRYAAYDDYAVLDAVCGNWPVPVAELPNSFTAEGAAPILVIGTTNDPATPYQNAVALAEMLTSAVLISYEGEGHTIYAQGVRCVDDAVDDYLIRGNVPSGDLRC